MSFIMTDSEQWWGWGGRGVGEVKCVCLSASESVAFCLNRNLFGWKSDNWMQELLSQYLSVFASVSVAACVLCVLIFQDVVSYFKVSSGNTRTSSVKFNMSQSILGKSSESSKNKLWYIICESFVNSCLHSALAAVTFICRYRLAFT